VAERTRSQRARRRNTRRRRAIAIAAGLAVATGGSAVGLAATSSDGQTRRVATVAYASVTQTIESSGTITSSLKLTPSFSVSGTVKSVDVKVGQTVRKGQPLAQLDITALQAAVDSANSTLATAQQRLQADEAGQTSIGGTGAATTAAFVQLTGTQPSGTNLSALIAQVEAAQAAVVAAQQNLDTGQTAVDSAQRVVDADVTRNSSLRDAQKSACDTSASSSPSPSPSASSSSGQCSAAMADYAAFADTLAGDVATLDAQIAAQDRYINDLQQAITKLGTLIDQLKSVSSGSGGGSTGPGQPSGSPSARPTGPAPSGAPSGRPTGSTQSGSGQNKSGGTGSTPNGGSSGQGSGQTAPPASAASIAADQAAIDAAQAQIAAAEQNRAAATLASPAAGRVAAVGLTVGNSSSGQTITIVGTGVQGVDVRVPLAEVDQVKVGQRVSVSADGRTSALHGTVESVGLLSSTSGSTTTFPVAVQLDVGSPQLYDGTGADVVITTGTATNVLAVPNSAIHTGARGTHTVTVLSRGRTSTVLVTLGVAGADVTQIMGGLKTGQQVVLANLSQPLPSSTTSNTGTFRPAQFGGAGGGRGTGG
jgi:multidrug efflux pump subunit AcrA (membrane-fusion protein)